MPKVLITGGLGFIFSHVTEYFVQKGWEIVVIDNCSAGSHQEISDGSFKVVEEDFSKHGAWQIVVEENPQYIVHAAAITDVDYSIQSPEETFRNNVLCNLNAFEAARKVTTLKKFLYVDTDEVYGECEYGKLENEILFPRNPYSVSKATGALMRYGYDNTYPELKLRTAEIRMCNIFGSRQDTTKILPQIVRSLKENYSIPLQNHGEGYREYLYVKNVPPLIDLILEKGNRAYNVTNNDGFTVSQLFRIVEKVTGRRVNFHASDRPGHDRWYRMDSTRLRSELDWKPDYSFEDGLRDYLVIEELLSAP